MATAASETNQSPGRKLDCNAERLDQLDAQSLTQAYLAVRQQTERLAGGLSAEDQNLQSMPGASPVKWHRAHTSWFFETFVLEPQLPGYRAYHPQFAYLYNSYYNGIGEQYPRAQRGLVSRPDAAEVGRYRNHVDEAMLALLDRIDPDQCRRLAALIMLGINHEQQHQELIVTDLKHAFSHNPLGPAWTALPDSSAGTPALEWVEHSPGLSEIGSHPEYFCYDNETPRHRVWLEAFALANRPVSCGEYLAFIEDRGYQRPELWLADGWDWVRRQAISAPLYWSLDDGQWSHYTLGGQRDLDPNEPVCHLSFYEAAAYAEWAEARLPTEAEWEHAASAVPVTGHFADQGRLHPQGADGGDGLRQLYGDVWEWTASSYAPYPGFKAAAGAVGEYNGKFMANQVVLRGGSCATPAGHIRPGYRNFFYPQDRWQFSGLRLARSLA
jgi:ergothioneine biosynthesis protein EgtB